MNIERVAVIAGTGLVLGLLAYVVLRGARGAARDAAEAAAAGVVGVVEGIGNVFGVPVTAVDKCRSSKAARDAWGASFNCPAADYLSWLSAGMPGNGASGSR